MQFATTTDLAHCALVEFECYATPECTPLARSWPAAVLDTLERALHNWQQDAGDPPILGETTYLSQCVNGRRVCRRLIHYRPKAIEAPAQFVSGLQSSGATMAPSLSAGEAPAAERQEPPAAGIPAKEATRP